MKAIILSEYGEPSVLHAAEVPEPVVGARDVLVRVCASSVNPIDYKVRSGHQRGAMRYNLPHVLGLDVSGVVLAVGAEVSRFKVGDEVYSSPSHKRPGCYAQRVAIHEDEVARKPNNLTHEEAASLPLVGLTAWQCLMPTLQKPGPKKVFIQAGAGGVGTFAIQLAKHHGAWIATTASPRNHALVEALGADRSIDYRSERFDDVLADMDVVLDALGGESRDRALAVVGRGGRVASICGGLPEATDRFGPNLGLLASVIDMLWFVVRGKLKGRDASLVLKRCDGAVLEQITELVEAGAIRPVIDRVLPMDQVADAHTYLQGGHAQGKVVLSGFA